MFNSSIGNQLIKELSAGSCKSSSLVEKVAIDQNCSIQSVYAALKKLREQSIVLLHKKKLLLNVVWIEEQTKFLKQARSAYLESSNTSEFSLETLEEGDKIIYQFKNPVLLDEMWGHVFMLLIEKANKSTPIMIYNYHSWFSIVRYNSEKTIFQSLFDREFKAYFSIAGKEELDLDICKKFIEPIGHSFSTGVDLGFENTKYLNIVGDYLIEVTLDEDVSENIDKFYSKYNNLSSADAEELLTIVSQRGRNRISIIKNARKAHRMRSKLAKDFLISAESRRFI